jgi:hypothetical protein
MEWSLPECGRQYIRFILNVNFLARGCVDVSDGEPAQLVKRICMIRYDKEPGQDSRTSSSAVTVLLKRLEAGDPRTIAIRDGIINVWRRIVPYLITHRGKEWWEVGFKRERRNIFPNS